MHPPETPSIGLPESTARHGSREGSTPRNRGRGKGRGRGGKGRGGGGEEGVEARRATPIGADGDATPEVAVEGEATMTARAIESAAINENHDSNNTNPDLSNTALSANNMLGVSHLGPAMVEAFYEDGSVFGYQELEQAPAPPPVEENSNDFHGPLESFYRAYFAQHPCDAYESDVSSTYDDDGEDADEDTVEIIMEPMHVSTNIPAGDPSSSKRRRLDDRTVILGSTQQDVVSDVVEGEKQDVKSHLMSKIPMQRKEQETSEDRYARVGLEMNRQLCLAARLESAKAIDPTRTELTASEMYTIELMHSTRRAVADAGKARRQQLAPSTKVSYDSYARHWRRWCKRKGYHVGKKVDFRVFHDKFIYYMQDGLAERGDDGGGDRRKAVLPFFAKGKKRRTDGTYSMTVPALQTVKAYVCSIVDLYRTQQLIGMKDMLQQPHPRSTVYRTMIAKYQERIAGDPLAEAKKYATIGHADGRELQNIQDLMRAAWKNRYNLSGIPTKNQPQKITSVRLRLLASWGHFMMMRGENLRYAKLPHVNLHSFANLSGGETPSRTLAIVLIMTQGKTMRYGGCTYGVAVRNVNTEICPIGALALYLFCLWDLTNDPPNFDESEWEEHYLAHGNGRDKQMSAHARVDGMSRLFEQTGIVTDQPTHFYRHSGANHALDSGASISAIQQHGGWCRDQSRLTTHYLHPLPKGVAYCMAGSTHHGQPPWIKREVLLPPVELQRMVFPFVERYYGGHPDWLQWTLNIMTNKPDNHDRPLTNRMPLPAQSNKSEVLRLKFLLLLVHLRKIFLQDAVVLQQFRPDEQSDYSRHHLFAHPLFKSVAFQMFSRDLSTAMDDAAPPRSDSLRLNAPALEHEIRNLDTKITEGLKHLKRHFDCTIDSLTTKFQSWLKLNETMVTTAFSNISTRQTDTFISALGRSSQIQNLALVMTLQESADVLQRNLRKAEEILGSSATVHGASLSPSTSHSVTVQQTHPQNVQRLQQKQLVSPSRVGVKESCVDLADDSEVEHADAEEFESELVMIEDDMDLNQTEQGTSSGPSIVLEPAQQTPETIPNLEERLDELAYELAYDRNLTHPVDMDFKYEMISRGHSLQDHWDEWFYGIKDNNNGRHPSIWRLNGPNRRFTLSNSHIAESHWRYADPAKSNNHYNSLWSWKKGIVCGVLTRMLTLTGDLRDRESEAIRLVEWDIKNSNESLHKFSKKHTRRAKKPTTPINDE